MAAEINTVILADLNYPIDNEGCVNYDDGSDHEIDFIVYSLEPIGGGDGDEQEQEQQQKSDNINLKENKIIILHDIYFQELNIIKNPFFTTVIKKMHTACYYG
ncbi:hypothetical protein ACTFIT_008149 [Dictyostelium discoideum]